MNRRQLLASASLAWGAYLIKWPADARAQPQPARSFRMSDGVTLAAAVEGNGPSLLLVHGASGSRHSFTALTPLVTERFTAYALDRRGYGASGGRTPHSLAREAEDIASVVSTLPAPVYVLAHSSGAVETLEAMRLASSVAGAILYEPPFGPLVHSTPTAVCDQVTAGHNEEAVMVFYNDYAHLPPAVIDGIRHRPGWQQQIDAAPALCNELTAIAGYRLDPSRFSAVHTPTTFLLGDQSAPVMADGVRQAVAAVPGATLTLLPGQQHGALVAAPEMIAKIVFQTFN